jgi:probable phosphoglycerate mutase
MTRVVLVRHAATAWSGQRYCGTSDPALSREGQADAERLAAELAGIVPAGARIVTSPLARARQTADEIAAGLGTACVEVDPRWREADFGLLEGLTFAQVELRRPELAARLLLPDAAVDWPGGEAHASLAGRVAAALDDIVRSGGTWIVVTHGGPLRLAVVLAAGVGLDRVAIPPPSGLVDLSIPIGRFDPAGSGPLGSSAWTEPAEA